MFAYTPIYRPAQFSAIPKGWEYLAAPSDLTTRPDLPASEYRFGEIGYTERLTKEDQERYELKYLGERSS